MTKKEREKVKEKEKMGKSGKNNEENEGRQRESKEGNSLRKPRRGFTKQGPADPESAGSQVFGRGGDCRNPRVQKSDSSNRVPVTGRELRELV